MPFGRTRSTDLQFCEVILPSAEAIPLRRHTDIKIVSGDGRDLSANIGERGTVEIRDGQWRFSYRRLERTHAETSPGASAAAVARADRAPARSPSRRRPPCE